MFICFRDIYRCLPQLLIPMEDVKRVCSFEPSMAVLINFFYRYMAYLLPALLKIGTVRSCHGHQHEGIERIVRFEVDMALVVSASGFAWSRALKQKLEQGLMDVKKIHNSPSKQPAISNLSLVCEKKGTTSSVAEALDELLALRPLYARPLAPFSSQMSGKQDQLSIYNTVKPKGVRWSITRKVGRGDEELRYRVRTLRRILPGGNEMGVSELLSEVESYVICLELQVSVLRTLLGAH